jgi:ubiquinone/menaquinone biosynthesis C-methylase UbiE
VQCDLSAGLLEAMDTGARDRNLRVQCDEEAFPFADETFDVVLSSLRYVAERFLLCF